MMRQVRAFLAGALLVGLIAFVSGAGTYAAFFSRTTNDGNGVGNSVDAGTVDLVDNDAGSAMFTVGGMRPGDPAVSSCITVTYNGSLGSVVSLYASVSGGLAPYLNLTVQAGTTTTGFGDCSGFTSTQVLYSGALSAFPTAYGSIVDPDPSWTTGTSHGYQFIVSLQNAPAAQGLSAAAAFTWEARNL